MTTITIPDNVGTLSDIDRSLSLYIDPIRLQKVYSLFLWDIDNISVYSSSNIDPSGSSSKAEYFFTVPPRVHEIEEQFNPSIVPTQNSGRFTESYGSLIKDIVVAGTTGLRPFKSQNQSSGSEVTGHDSVIFLRNIFRLYSDLQSQNSPNIVLVWRNIKDDDYWIVEPVTFKLQQSSNSPLTYEYNIHLKTLARFDKSLYSVLLDPQREIQSDRSFFNRMKDRVQKLISTFFNVISQGDIFLTNKIANPIKRVLSTISAVNQSVFGAAEKLIETSLDLLIAVDATLTNYSGAVITKNLYNLKRSLRRLKSVCYGILTEKRYKKAAQTVESRRTRVIRSYRKPNLYTGTPTYPSTGGSSSFLGNNPSTTHVSQHVIGRNDDIRSLAQQLLGDSKKWQELVILNDLKPPYIDVVPKDGVLVPGDTLLFPARAKTGVDMVHVSDSPDQDYDNESSTPSTNLVDQIYGRDLRLVSVSSDATGTTELTDLCIGQNGDLSTISGIDNIQQAIRVKFITEKGELKNHPNFGAKFPIGTKSTISSFNDFRLGTAATLVSDERIDDVSNLSFVSDGDTLSVSAKIKLISSQKYINTHFALRRF